MTAFTTSINRLLAQVSHWEQPRWSSAAPAGGSTADVVFSLVQRLADLGADAEHREHRPVPREHDQTLPDQLRVMSADLLGTAATDATMASATAAVDEAHRALP